MLTSKIRNLTLLTLLFLLQAPLTAQAKYQGRLQPGVWTQSMENSLKSAIERYNLVKMWDHSFENACPGAKNSSSKRFTCWRQFFVALAYKESLHGQRNYIKFRGGINKGLFQIDPRLKDDYKCQNVDLFKAHDNILCGVKMAAHLYNKRGAFLKGKRDGLAAYWQPLRSSTRKNAANRAWIIGRMKNAAKTGKIDYISTNKNLIALSEAEFYNNLKFELNDSAAFDIDDSVPTLSRDLEVDSDPGVIDPWVIQFDID